MSKLYLIRHAQASYMSTNYDQLSELGYEQSTILGQFLAGQKIRFDKIYLGPLLRHRQTLDQVKKVFVERNIEYPVEELMPELDEHKGPEVLKMVLPLLREKYPVIDQWASQGHSNPEASKKNSLKVFDMAMEKWAAGELDDFHPEHLPNWVQFRSQVNTALTKLMEAHKNDSGINVLAFTSGGTISAFTGHVLGMTDERKVMSLNGLVYNTSISEYIFSKDKINVLGFNNAGHLPKSHLTFV